MPEDLYLQALHNRSVIRHRWFIGFDVDNFEIGYFENK